IVLAITLGLTDGITVMLLLPLLAATGVDVVQGGVGQLAGYVTRVFEALHIHPTLGTVLALFVGITAARTVVAEQRTLATARTGSAWAMARRNRLYASITRANWLFLGKTRTADLTHVMTAGLARITTAAYEMLNMVASLFIAAAYIALSMRVSMPMTAAVLACGGALIGFLSPTLL